MTPHVRVLSHGAERSGPPIHLARLLSAWHTAPPPFTVSVDVARGGPLVAEFARFADVRVARLDGAAPARRAARRLDRIDRSGRSGDRLRAAARRHHLAQGSRSARGAPATERRLTRRSPSTGREPCLVVVNGATAPTAELLADIPAAIPAAMIAHELSTGWCHNIDESDRRLFLERCSAFLAVSDAVRSFLIELGVSPSAITVIRGPVNHAATPVLRAPPSGPGWRIIGVGMTDWRKAPIDWLRVVARVAATAGHRDGAADWFGGVRPGPAVGEDAWSLEVQRRRLGLSSLVTFHGEVAEPWSTVDPTLTPTVFVSSAVEDAAPLVVYEAAAAGIPVVTFDGGGAAEFVRIADAGIVCGYPDVDAAGDAVAELVGDPERLTALGHNGMVFAHRELRAEHTAARISEWLISLLDAHAERST